MKTLLLLIAFTVVINGLLYIPLLLNLRRLKRAVRLQKAKAEIATCAEEIQIYLAKRHVRSGELVHDVHYEAINQAQHYDKYLTVLPLIFKKKATAVKGIRKQIQEEMDQLPPNIKKITNRFNMAYLRAAYYRQPKRFWMAICVSLFVMLVHKISLKIKQRQPISLKHIIPARNNQAKIIDFQKARPTFDARAPVYAWVALWLIAIGVVSSNQPSGISPSSILFQQSA